MHGRPELAASVACGPLPLVDSLPVPFQLVDHELHDLVQVLDAEVVGVGPLPELVATGPRRRHLLDLAPQRLDLCPSHGYSLVERAGAAPGRPRLLRVGAAA